MREGDAVSNGAVSRGASGEPRGLLDRRAGHQRLDSFVHVAEPLFEPHHGLAAGGEAEMPRLDDPGVHRTDRNLVQALAFDGKELIGVTNCRRFFARTEWMPHVPEAEIEPGPRIRRPDGDVTIKTLNSAFETDGRRVQRADGGKASIRAGEACHRDAPVGVVHDRHVNHGKRRPVGPQPEKRGLARGDFARHLAPGVRRHAETRPGPMVLGALALPDDIERLRHITPAIRRHSETTPPRPAAYKCRQRTRSKDGRTSARKKLALWRSVRAARRRRCC